MSLDEYQKVAEAKDIPSGEAIGVDVDGIEISLYYVDGEYYATNNRCPHQKAPLCKSGEKKINGEKCWNDRRGGFSDDPSVSCPWHLWEINLKTGEHEVTGKRVATFDVKEDNGDLLVKI
jgi:nitrite reductase (NADH) small subunit